MLSSNIDATICPTGSTESPTARPLNSTNSASKGGRFFSSESDAIKSWNTRDLGNAYKLARNSRLPIVSLIREELLRRTKKA